MCTIWRKERQREREERRDSKRHMKQDRSIDMSLHMYLYIRYGVDNGERSDEDRLKIETAVDRQLWRYFCVSPQNRLLTFVSNLF